jgi:hypothetical protein
MSKHPIALAIVLAACAALPAAASADEPPIAVSHASGGADVSDLAQTTVVLHAGVVANGHRLSCEVDYARDDLEDDDSGPYTSSVPCREALQPGAPGEQPVSAALSGLQPGSHYRFQFLIKDTDDASITRHTNESSFTMLMVAPGVVTGDAVDVRDLGATLTGTIDPHGDRTTCRFDFGPTAAYDNEVSCATFPGSGEGPVAVRADLSGLDPGATYHYRLVGAKSDQEVEGADHTFTVPAIATGTPPTTGATPPRPIVSPSPTTPGHLTLPASVKTHNGTARLKLHCTSAPCHGTLTLKAKLTTHARTRTIGHTTIDLTAGQTTTITVRLTAAAKAALRHHHRLTAQVTGAGIHRTLRLT